ncbi:MAG: GNAT family N-acetyltransferase [Methanomassiliicoccus sp.]|nr:GNAT family N-acetyltransferase [Methanomassiliicoccus sp.]
MGEINTRVPGFTIRFAREGDEALILFFIRSLADYEGLASGVVTNEETIRDSMFMSECAEALIGMLDGKPVAFALFFHTYAGFLGKPNLYVEDLFVVEEHRGKGLGKSMIACLAKIADQRDCHRMDWLVLDWNEPTIAFYKGLGAAPVSDMTVYRLSRSYLQQLSREL